MKLAQYRNATGMNAANLEAKMWDGQFTLDGAVAPWKDVPIGSIYVKNASGAVTMYGKTADNKATADWVTMANSGGGASGVGYDLKANGATAGNYMLWDASENQLNIPGTSSTLVLGAFHSTTKGSGVLMKSSGKTAALRVYTDDNNAAAYSATVNDQRTILGRDLLTADQTGGDWRRWGVMGHTKAYDAYWNDEQVGGVHGYLELVRDDATMTLGGNGITAGVQATVENSGVVTVNTNHVLAGVASVSKLTSQLAQTGKAAAFYAGIYDATNWSDGTARAKWGYGLYIDSAAATKAISVGAYASDVNKAMPVNGSTWNVGFFSDDAGAKQTTGTVVRNLISRTYFSIDQDTAAHDYDAIRGHIKAASGIDFSGDTSTTACVRGYLETAGATVCGAGAFLSGVMGELWGDSDITGTGKIAGVMSRLYAKAGSTSGTTAAFMATKQFSSTQNWPYGLYIDSATVDIRLQGGPCILSGTGAPGMTAPKGSIYLRSDNSSHDDTIYCNTDGSTTWAAIVSG